MSQADELVAVTKKFVVEEYVEKGDNLTIMGKWYGMNGQPWCAMFVSYCFAQLKLSKLVAASSSKGFASCDAGMKWFAKHGQLVPVGKAQPGDIVFFKFDDDPVPDHVGIVYKKRKNFLVCLEGNTSPQNRRGSQSNGGGCYKRKRPYSLVMAVARPKWTDL